MGRWDNLEFSTMKKLFRMIIDNYAQVMLTVIAASLVMLAWQHYAMRDDLNGWLSGIDTNLGAIEESVNSIDKQIGR
jgi:hypothetical protein